MSNGVVKYCVKYSKASSGEVIQTGGGGHSHFGGAVYVGLLRPRFQHRCCLMTPYFY